MTRAIWLVWAGLAAATVPISVSAETLTFSYSGLQQSAGLSALGTGSFTFADGLSTVSEASLTSFSFVDVVSYNGMFNGIPTNTTYTFGLADLMGFSLTLANGAPGVFTMSTDNAAPGFASSFSVPNIGVSGPPYLGVTGIALAGPVTFTPEPSSLGLIAMSAMLFGFRRMRLATTKIFLPGILA